jgi:hypothetical protein
MSTSNLRSQTRLRDGLAHDAADRSPIPDLVQRCAEAKEHATRRHTRRAILGEVRTESFTDLRERRKAIDDVAFPPYDDLSRTPTDVVEIERRHLAGAQAEANQENEDRAIAPPRRRPRVAGAEKLLDFRGRQITESIAVAPPQSDKCRGP